MYLPVSVAFLAIAGAAAQGVGGISQQCQSTLISLAQDSGTSACLNPPGLIGILTAANSSIVGPVNNWLSGVCSSPPCSNETLSNIVSNVTSGCNAELSSFGLNPNDTQATTQAVQDVYPTVRNISCLSDGGTLCVTQLLTDIQNESGTLSLANIDQIISNFLSGGGIPQNVTCSNCTKAAYNIVNTNFPGAINETVNSTLTNTCGSNFTDGTNPPQVSESANQSSGGTTTENSGIHPVAAGSVVLAVLFGAVIALL